MASRSDPGTGRPGPKPRRPTDRDILVLARVIDGTHQNPCALARGRGLLVEEDFFRRLWEVGRTFRCLACDRWRPVTSHDPSALGECKDCTQQAKGT